MRLHYLTALLAFVACAAHSQQVIVTPQTQTYGYQSWKITIPQQEPLTVTPMPAPRPQITYVPVPTPTQQLSPGLAAAAFAAGQAMAQQSPWFSMYDRLAQQAHTPEQWAGIQKYRGCYMNRETGEVRCAQ